MAPDTPVSTNMLWDGPRSLPHTRHATPIWYGLDGVRATLHTIHTKYHADTVNACGRALTRSAGATEQCMHAGGTMGDRGPQAASQLIRAVLTCETDGPQHPCHASGWFSAICTFSLGDLHHDGAS